MVDTPGAQKNREVMKKSIHTPRGPPIRRLWFNQNVGATNSVVFTKFMKYDTFVAGTSLAGSSYKYTTQEEYDRGTKVNCDTSNNSLRLENYGQ